MSPTTDANATSPKTAEDKVQDGRVQKSKTKKKDGLVPNYKIDGRTFACEGCKNGHRVSKCTHAAHRPVLMTNDPGRPSADQKRHCDCPRNCNCTKKNCKCERNCTCIRTMYMLVYVPVGEQQNDKEKQKGEWKIDYEVITDLKGKPLSEEEIEIRKQEKSRQQQGRIRRSSTLGAVNDKPPSQGSVSGFTTPGSVKTEIPANVSASTAKSGCCHRKNIQGPRPMIQVKSENSAPVQIKRSLGSCRCGDNCDCAMCLDHPNNQTSQRIIQERAARLSNNDSSSGGNGLDQNYRTPPQEKNLSCMGTNPQFAWHTNPNPSAADLQAIFGTNNTTGCGYYLSYPVRSYSPVPAAGPGDCCSSTVCTRQTHSTDQDDSSQFLSFPDSNAQLSPYSQLLQDYAGAPGYMPQQASSQANPSTPANLGSGLFQPEHHVGEATVAGLYGMPCDWPADTNPSIVETMPALWSSGSSRLELPPNSSEIASDFKINATFSPFITLPDVVNDFNSIDAPLSLPSQSHITGQKELPTYRTQYQYESLGHDYTYKLGQTSPTIATPSAFTPGLFEGFDDVPRDMPVSNHALNSSDIAFGHTYSP